MGAPRGLCRGTGGTSGGDMGVGALGGACMVAGAHWHKSLVGGPVGVG